MTKTFNDDLDAILYIEEEDQPDEETLVAAWQHLVDTGIVWKLQGFYGRNASQMIEAGILTEKTDAQG